MYICMYRNTYVYILSIKAEATLENQQKDIYSGDNYLHDNYNSFLFR